MRQRVIVTVLFAMSCAATAPAAAGVPRVSPADAQQIRKVGDDFCAAYNRHDMKAFADLYTEGADFVVASGRHLKGRDEIFRFHADLHKGVLKDRQLAGRFEDIRLLRPGVALGHMSFEGNASSGDERQKTTGYATVVLLKADGRWLIETFHSTLRSGSPGGVLPSDPK